MSRFSRRKFLGTSAAAAASSLLPLKLAAAQTGETAQPPDAGSRTGSRAVKAYQVRVDAARFERDQDRVQQPVNGDEARYDDGCSCYSKALPHDAIGNADMPALQKLIEAIGSARHEDLEQIPLGGYVKLANPHASLAFELAGPDGHQLTVAAPPPFASARMAAELTELYWMALLRDVPFSEYETSAVTKDAATELGALRGFADSPERVASSPATLFRGGTKRAATGPYVSWFLLRDIPLTPIRVPQKIRTAAPGKDYMTTVEDWLAIQNGALAAVNEYDPQPRYIRNGRDLGEYVHKDFTFQHFLNAALMLLKISAPMDGGVPYQYSVNQGGFVTFGPADILHFVTSVANGALKAAWYQKWVVHRTARPEEVAARVHFHLAGKAKYPLHADAFASEAVARTRKQYGTALLPQAYPEGSPSHPAFPSGHAVIAGACTTVLKAWFNESWVLPKAVTAASDGLSTQPWTGADLTVGGELDKLAENVSIGRNFAGIHWRCDALEGLKLGESYAIQYLREMKITRPELFHGFDLVRFDGTRTTV
jgi:hypothetical protein